MSHICLNLKLHKCTYNCSYRSCFWCGSV